MHKCILEITEIILKFFKAKLLKKKISVDSTERFYLLIEIIK